MVSRSIARFITLTTVLPILFGLSRAQAAPAPVPPELLSVSAPTPTEMQTVGLWYEHHIPAKFRARQAISVSLLTGQEMTIYLDGNGDDASADSSDGDIDGVFQDGPPNITLRLPTDGVPDTLTFAHEYGHFIWFDMLTKAERKHYTAIYDRQKAAHRLVTDYSYDSVEEGFAEAFSFYASCPAILKEKDPLSAAFLDQWQPE